LTPQNFDVRSKIKFATLNSQLQLINMMYELNFGAGGGGGYQLCAWNSSLVAHTVASASLRNYRCSDNTVHSLDRYR